MAAQVDLTVLPEGERQAEAEPEEDGEVEEQEDDGELEHEADNERDDGSQPHDLLVEGMCAPIPIMFPALLPSWRRRRSPPVARRGSSFEAVNAPTRR